MQYFLLKNITWKKKEITSRNKTGRELYKMKDKEVKTNIQKYVGKNSIVKKAEANPER